METGQQYKVSESLLSSWQASVSERECINRPCVGTSDEISRNKDHNYCIGCGACRGNGNDDSSRKSSFLWCVIAALVIIILSIIINWLL